jgi:hypothetical protein
MSTREAGLLHALRAAEAALPEHLPNIAVAARCMLVLRLDVVAEVLSPGEVLVAVLTVIVAVAHVDGIDVCLEVSIETEGRVAVRTLEVAALFVHSAHVALDVMS